MYSKGDPLPVSSQGWTQAEGEVLCRDLGCKGYKNHIEEEADGLRVWEQTFNCSAVKKTPQNIWDCKVNTTQQVAVNKKQLYLRCQGKVPVGSSFVGTQR